ncbi:MAG: hypothetical protein MJ218_02825 [Opitutales bacterium]|nr:hypothetical protein [Opitutales bacterium]
MKKLISIILLILINLWLMGSGLSKWIRIHRLSSTQLVMASTPAKLNALNTSYREKIFPWKSYMQLQQSQQALKSLFKAVLLQEMQWGAATPDPLRPRVFRHPVTITGFVLHLDCYPLLEALAHSNLPIWVQQCTFQRNGLCNQGLQFTCALQVATLTETTSIEPSNLHSPLNHSRAAKQTGTARDARE